MLSLKYCQNLAEAEDNLHNSFIEIFTNIKKYRGDGSFEGWIKRITINKAISSYKKTYDLIPLKEDHNEKFEVNQEEISISVEEILKHVQELPNQYRLVFCLFELDDYSHQEISEQLGISVGASKSNLNRAKTILKEKIKPNNSFPLYIVNNGK